MLTHINFVPGDIIRVFEKIKEGDKSRIQVFEGEVLGIKRRRENKSIRVMKMVGHVSVEKIYPINSPNVEKVTIKAHSKTKVRRAKLYYKRLPRVNP